MRLKVGLGLGKKVAFIGLWALILGFAESSQGDQLEPRRGLVVSFFPEKGFGFIAPEDGSRDVFLHISEIERAYPPLPPIEVGVCLSFFPEMSSNGVPIARDLKLCSDLEGSASNE